MLFITLTLVVLAIVVIASLVVAFVAYPQQGRTIPRASRLSRALQRLVDRTGLDPDEDEAATGGSLGELHDQWRDGRRDQLPHEPHDRNGEPSPRR